jgi:flagellum-specific peptidoglycan hydrolase FlgJ
MTDEKMKLETGNSKPDAASLVQLPVSLSPQQLDFLEKVTGPARAGEQAEGIPACITIAQAIFEAAGPAYVCSHCGNRQASGVTCNRCGSPVARDGSSIWGGSSLFRLANNPFGIKYSQLAKREGYAHFDAMTWEMQNGQRESIPAEFVRFPSLASAFQGHAMLLRSPAYAPAYSVRDFPTEFAERLGPKTSQTDHEHCGYSTNPSYSAELIKAVNVYRLNDPRALEWYATGKDPEGSRQQAMGTRQ